MGTSVIVLYQNIATEREKLSGEGVAVVFTPFVFLTKTSEAAN